MNAPGSISTSVAEAVSTRPRFLRRNEAAAYVRETWAMPCSRAWLAKLAVVGGGPLFRKAGRFPIYAIEDLDDWARSRISEPVGSTAELATGYAR